jgi:aldose 1-epimerase
MAQRTSARELTVTNGRPPGAGACKPRGALAGALLAAAALVGAATDAAPKEAGTTKTVFGRTAAGDEVALYTITNAAGAEVAITPWGARIVAIRVPDREGKMADVVLGFDHLDGYLADNPYFGAVVGRYANRIGNGQFTLDGREYVLSRNSRGNQLHGGDVGFDKKLWRASEINDRSGRGIRLKYMSPDGEEGYPGNLDIAVTYTLSPTNELRIDYQATTDRPTVINLTNHSYFNLAGKGDILGHVLWLKAHRFTPVDAGLIPTGEIRSVRNTPFDFTVAHAIGERINEGDEQLRFGNGYDHNYVLDGPPGNLRLAARITEPASGRVMEVLTTEPGLQLYSGNFLGSIAGKGGEVYARRSAFCVETEHFPDSPNKANFPSTVLRPGQRYHAITVYRFSTET